MVGLPLAGGLPKSGAFSHDFPLSTLVHVVLGGFCAA